MHKDSTLKRISMTELVHMDGNWNKYSMFHDHFLEELSYEREKFFNSDIWQLNYI